MRRKVLLADDSLSIQKMFGLYLEKCEIDVVTMSNGEMAVSRLSAIQPDLILADVFMPGRTGYEVCEYVKQHPDFKHIPVLLLTGKFEPYDAQEAKRVKADGHIVKPIAEQEFVSLVRTTLERAAPPAAPPPAAAPPAAAPPALAQTQIFGSVPPPKEPSALGGSLPRFHFGSASLPDPLSSEAPPPTIKVSPSLLDDGRLPDLDPLLPLDAPPPAPVAADAPDFILDLPPADQAPPVLSYPEPPRTLSAPIQRPTFSQMSPPDFGTTTAKLDPSELPELLAAPPAAAPVVADMESPLELDDATAPPPVAEVSAAPVPQPTTTAPEAAEAPVPVAREAETATATEPATAAAPPDASGLTAAISTAATELISAPEPRLKPPIQVATPWSPPEPSAPPVTASLDARAETSSFSPVTAPLETAPTGNLMAEPIPPPDFIAGLVSPTAETAEPSRGPAEDAATTPPPGSALESPQPPATDAGAAEPMPAPPTFEVVMEDEPPVRGTDLLPDELLALRERQRAQVEAGADTPADVSPAATAETPASFEFAVPPPETATDHEEAKTTEIAFAPAATDETSLPSFSPAPFSAVAPVAELPPPMASGVEPALGASPADHLPGVAPPAELTDAADPAPIFEPTPLEAAPLPPVPDAPVAETREDAPPAPAESAAAKLYAEETEATPARVATAETEALTQPISTDGLPPIAAVDEVAADPSPTLVDWSNFALPPALVDDIVRRVVAEISDRVVREIAWEVVPDLAELLIKKRLANGHRGPDA